MKNRIRDIRKNQGKSQEWLGAQIGVGKAMVSKLEKGQSPLTQKYMESIATALKCKPIDLISNKSSNYATESHNIEQDNSDNMLLKSQNEKNIIQPSNDLIPLYGATTQSGVVRIEDEFMIDKTMKHPALAHVKGGFAVQAVDDSMSPRYDRGERVYIHPHLVAVTGQYCLAELGPAGDVVIRKLIGETDKDYKFLQLNPRQETLVDKKKVRRIYAVIGSYHAR